MKPCKVVSLFFKVKSMSHQIVELNLHSVEVDVIFFFKNQTATELFKRLFSMPVLPSSIMCRFSHSDALSLCPDHTTDFWDAFAIMAMLRSIAHVIDVFRAITLPSMFPSE